MRSLRLIVGVVVGLVLVGGLSWLPATAAAGGGSVGSGWGPTLCGVLDPDRGGFFTTATGTPGAPGMYEVVIADLDPQSPAAPTVFYVAFSFDALGCEHASIALQLFAMPQDVDITTRVYTYSPTQTLVATDPWTVRTHHFPGSVEVGSANAVASSVWQWLPLPGTTAPLFPYTAVVMQDPNPAQIALPSPQLLAIESGPTGLFPVN